jgi:hypothetical protein
MEHKEHELIHKGYNKGELKNTFKKLFRKIYENAGNKIELASLINFNPDS